MRTLNRFLRDDSGGTAIEYGLTAAGISVVIITVVNTLEPHQFRSHLGREVRAEGAASASRFSRSSRLRT